MSVRMVFNLYIKILIIISLIFVNNGSSKKHKINVVSDKRSYIHFTSFGLAEGGLHFL